MHGPSWAIEHGEEPVSGCLHFRAAEPVELVPHNLVMVIEQFTPALIAQVSHT